MQLHDSKNFDDDVDDYEMMLNMVRNDSHSDDEEEEDEESS